MQLSLSWYGHMNSPSRHSLASATKAAIIRAKPAYVYIIFTFQNKFVFSGLTLIDPKKSYRRCGALVKLTSRVSLIYIGLLLLLRKLLST